MDIVASSVWRTISVALLTFILGAGATWLNDKDRMNRDQVMELIHAEAPPAADWKSIKDEMVILQVEQARTEEKLDLLLKRVK